MDNNLTGYILSETTTHITILVGKKDSDDAYVLSIVKDGRGVASFVRSGGDERGGQALQRGEQTFTERG